METKTDNRPIVIERELAQFTGTEKYHKHPLSKLLYTDGIAYMAERCGAYWLIDVVASYQPALSLKFFQVWNLKKNETGNGAVVTCVEDDGQPELVHQNIEFTDFPLPEIEFYCIDGVVLLKSEY